MPLLSVSVLTHTLASCLTFNDPEDVSAELFCTSFITKRVEHVYIHLRAVFISTELSVLILRSLFFLMDLLQLFRYWGY